MCLLQQSDSPFDVDSGAAAGPLAIPKAEFMPPNAGAARLSRMGPAGAADSLMKAMKK
jgi:hypothetical protein